MDQPNEREKKVVVVGAVDSDAVDAIAAAAASTSISSQTQQPAPMLQQQPEQPQQPTTNQLQVASPNKDGNDAKADSDSDEDESKCGPSGCPAPGSGGAQRSNAVLPPFATEPKDENAEPVPIDPDVMIIDPDCVELELNHCRIGRIEALEPLTKIER